MNTFSNMEVANVKRYYNLEYKLGSEHENDAKEINTFFKEFKEQYRKADSKKEFFRVNNIKDNDSILYNLKLLLDLFDWEEITIEKINKVAKEHKKKPENILKTLCRRIEEYEKIKR